MFVTYRKKSQNTHFIIKEIKPIHYSRTKDKIVIMIYTPLRSDNLVYTAIKIINAGSLDQY